MPATMRAAPRILGEIRRMRVSAEWSLRGSSPGLGPFFFFLDRRVESGYTEMQASCYPQSSVASRPPSPRLWPTDTSWDRSRVALSSLHVASPHPLSPTAASWEPAPSLAGKLPEKGRSLPALSFTGALLGATLRTVWRSALPPVVLASTRYPTSFMSQPSPPTWARLRRGITGSLHALIGDW